MSAQTHVGTRWCFHTIAVGAILCITNVAGRSAPCWNVPLCGRILYSRKISTILLTWRRGHQTTRCGHVECRRGLVLSHRDRFGSVDGLNPKLTRGFRPITAFTLVALSGTSLTINITYLLTYLLYGAESFLRSQPVNFAASQEIPRIYETRKFLTVPTNARHLSLSWANSIQSPRLPPPNFLKIHLNIILPSTSWSPQ
jgi:hypothetical protein